jgi:hypothetical protein
MGCETGAARIVVVEQYVSKIGAVNTVARKNANARKGRSTKKEKKNVPEIQK